MAEQYACGGKTMLALPCSGAANVSEKVIKHAKELI
jgi:hypothetical protein